MVDNIGAKVNGQLVPRDASRSDGWEYTAVGSEVEVYGPYCDEIRTAASNRVQIIYACEGAIIRQSAAHRGVARVVSFGERATGVSSERAFSDRGFALFISAAT